MNKKLLSALCGLALGFCVITLAHAAEGKAGYDASDSDTAAVSADEPPPADAPQTEDSDDQGPPPSVSKDAEPAPPNEEEGD